MTGNYPVKDRSIGDDVSITDVCADVKARLLLVKAGFQTPVSFL